MKKLLTGALVIVAIALAFYVYSNYAANAKNREYAAAFASKTWYYSSQDEKQWLDRAESGLQGFDDDGNPVHVSSVWGTGKWVDENTISWDATNGSHSLWKAFANPPY